MSKHSGQYVHERSDLDAQLNEKLNAIRYPMPTHLIPPAQQPVQPIVVQVSTPEPEKPSVISSILQGASAGWLFASIGNRNNQW